ncbi:hypothetical protein ACGFI9_12260 [Micromonospora sp. NPDC048930]|uniref:hypothetical protein n=1 Tax=Micromonospora sp. NPDC048930 TaxID=3364261 RepID=UPI003721A3EA
MGEEQARVPCLDCGTPCRSALSRSRRIGSGCWRKRRRKARAQAAPVPLPGLSGRRGRAGQDLLDAATEDGTP